SDAGDRRAVPPRHARDHGPAALRPLRERGAHFLRRLPVGTRNRRRGRSVLPRRRVCRPPPQRAPHAVRHACAGHRRRAGTALRGTHWPRLAPPDADRRCLAPRAGRCARSHRSAPRPMSTVLGRVLAELTAAGAADVTAADAHSARCRLSRERVAAVADRMAAIGLEVQLLCATDTRQRSGDFTLTYVFAPPQGRPQLTALVTVPAGEPRFPSLALRSFAASRFEREIPDLLGLVPVGHPDLRRLAVHQFWPDGYFPQRRDATIRRDFADAGQPFPFRRVEGDGLFEITVGPVHAGIIEPGHFRFTVEGETIVNLETRLGFVHKGTEKLFETLAFERTPALAECVSGDETVAHALTYCQALAGLSGVEIPRRAAWLRVILLELERLYDHLRDVGMIVNDTGFGFGHAHCFRLREELLRLNARLTGHRLMRGAIVPGGVADTVDDAVLAELPGAVGRLVAEFFEIAELSLDNSLVL